MQGYITFNTQPKEEAHDKIRNPSLVWYNNCSAGTSPRCCSIGSESPRGSRTRGRERHDSHIGARYLCNHSISHNYLS